MKHYEKPILEIVELRNEEQLAGSTNCAATTGKGNGCPPNTAWSQDQDHPQ